MEYITNKLTFKTIFIIISLIIAGILIFAFFADISKNPTKGVFVYIDLLQYRG